MNIAILGTDADAVRLAAAAVDAGHNLTWLGDVRPPEAAAFRELAPQLNDRGAEWEILLDGAVADAVVVGSGTASDELRAEQLKRIANERVPLLVIHPAIESVLAYYEVDMIRRELGGTVWCFNPLASHPVLLQLADWVRNGHPTVGRIHQVTCERRLIDVGRSSVLHHFARDAELIAATAGHVRRVSAIGPTAGEASYASLQVQMTTDGPASLRWSVVAPTARGQGLTLTLVGERGAVSLDAPDDPATGDAREWQLETTANGAQERESLLVHDAPLACVEQFAAAVEQRDLQPRDAASTWEQATRAMEVVDAVELSLQKGRMIDVYQQQLTERLAFRGRMAAIGCALLLISLVVLVAVAILGGAEQPGGRPPDRSWGLLLLAVLAFFLLLQALPLLASKLKPR